MKYNQLVVNGCSYMEAYAQGGGHKDLAALLGIESSTSLAIGGSANSRILRTTLKHSYSAAEPTLYVLGMTFVGREEVPILSYKYDETADTSFEGRWVNPQNQQFSNRWEHFWKESDSREWVNIHEKTNVYSLLDRTEDLMYRMVSAISDLTRRGHQVIMFQQADDSYMITDNGRRTIDSPRLKLFDNINIIGGFKWQSIPWQHEQGVPYSTFAPTTKNILTSDAASDTPDYIKHRALGAHKQLNEYLVNYINEVHL